MGLPVISRCKRHDTSFRVMVISPIGRWKDEAAESIYDQHNGPCKIGSMTNQLDLLQMEVQ